jgi:TrmH family RNA methyltransferase
MTPLSSTSNKHVKEFKALQEKSRFRKSELRFTVEGIREMSIALKAGYHLEKLFVQPKLCDLTSLKLPKEDQFEHFEVDQKVYQYMAYRASTEGVVGVFQQKKHDPQHNSVSSDRKLLVLVLENIEKPGNLGAIFRTADAAKVDMVCLANCSTDLYNPNCIRSSLGCCLSVPSISGSNQEIRDWLITHGVRSYAATLQNSNPYFQESFKESTAFVMGSEADGLSSFWRTESSASIVIPMQGLIDSMNVSVATAVLTFEALRQRNA